MKLFKKLMPIATVASCVAIVAPIATSCNKGTSLEWDYSKGIYEFDITKPKYSGTAAEILDKYFEDIAKNKKIVCEDYIIGSSTGLSYATIGEGKLKITVNSINKSEHRMSFTAKDNTLNLKITAKDIIYTIELDTLLGKSGWVLLTDSSKLPTDDKWSLVAEKGDQKLTINKSNYSTYSDSLVYCYYISSYLGDCTIA